MEDEKLFNYFKNFSLGEINSSFMFTDNSNKKTTLIEPFKVNEIKTYKFYNEYWTSEQRKSSSIHEISYRACFKAQLPHFFISLLTGLGDIVYDPFSGRGTTIIEAALLDRRVISNDINPLSKILAFPRLEVPNINHIVSRLDSIVINYSLKADIDLSMFYHPKTEAEIVSIRNYLEERKINGKEDAVDRWIRMVATNRLTGHSSGFFSVYTLPPNQAVSQESQIKINRKRNQSPEYRDTKKIITQKTLSLLKKINPKDIVNLRKASTTALFLEKDARDTKEIPDNYVNLIVTSPPFLDVVQYSKDNWLRCWFNNIEPTEIEKKITMSKTIEEWCAVMKQVFEELYRITKPGGWVAFEVGEVRNGSIKLEEFVIPLGFRTGFNCFGVVVNLQKFTKTSNIWGVKNNECGTNSNRIVLFRKA